METTATATATSFFEKFYSASKEALDASKKPFVQKRLARAYQSAIDGLDVEILRLESQVQSARQDFEDPDLNLLVDLVSEINDQKRNRAILVAEYEVMFGIKLGA